MKDYLKTTEKNALYRLFISDSFPEVRAFKVSEMLRKSEHFVPLNPIAHGILRLSQLWGWDFYPTPQKTMLKLFD